MSKNLLSKEEILNLSNNKYVKKLVKKDLHTQMNLKLYLLLNVVLENYQLIFSMMQDFTWKYLVITEFGVTVKGGVMLIIKQRN